MIYRIMALLMILLLVAACGAGNNTTEEVLPSATPVAETSGDDSADTPAEEVAPSQEATATNVPPTPTPENAGLSDTTDEDARNNSAEDASEDSGEVTGDPGSGFGLGDPLLEGEGFAAEISGAVTLDVEGEGYYSCENGRYALRPVQSGMPRLTLLLPANIGSGQHNLTENNNEESNISASIFLEGGEGYNTAVDGLLVLDSIANGPNEQITGSFEFTSSNGANEITVRGQFDFTSITGVFYCN